MNGLMQFVAVLFYWDFDNEKVGRIQSDIFWHFKMSLHNKDN